MHRTESQQRKESMSFAALGMTILKRLPAVTMDNFFRTVILSEARTCAKPMFSRSRRTPKRSIALRACQGILPITLSLALAAVIFLALVSCSQPADSNTLVMIIESSPTNLDPRVGLDAQSERIGELLFDALLTRDQHLNVQPGLAERWETPDPLTYIFHLHHAVTFHDGRPLTARDVKWTFDSLLGGKLLSTKTATYRYVDRIEAPDDFTVIFHLKEPNATLLWNLSEGAIGIVPYGALDDITANPSAQAPSDS